MSRHETSIWSYSDAHGSARSPLGDYRTLTQECLLEARGITWSFHSGKAPVDVLRGADLVLHRGELTAIVGVAGSGKSTLLHVLGLLDTPDAGEIVFDGRDVARLDPGESNLTRNASFGFVLESSPLMPEFTILDNMMIAAAMERGKLRWLSRESRIRERATTLLDLAGLRERALALPARLSMVERRRIAVLRSLMRNPAIVFCDEPAGDLDADMARDIYALLRRINVELGQTLLVTTQDQGVAAYADRVLTLRDGRLVNERDPASANVFPSA